MASEVVVADGITKRFARRDVVDRLSFTVHHGEVFALLAALNTGGRLAFVPAPDGASHAVALREGSTHGILTRRSDGSFELLVAKDPRYRTELATALDELVRRERLSRRGLDVGDLQQILQPAQLDVRFVDSGHRQAGRGESALAAISVGMVMLAVFTSMASLLTGITGEKQLRVTESIVSIVPAQAWIDGKILGIGAYALVNVINMAVGGLIVALAATLAWGFTLPDAAHDRASCWCSSSSARSRSCCGTSSSRRSRRRSTIRTLRHARRSCLRR